jgi:hypothetical protein
MNLLLHSPSNLVNPLARQRFMGFGTGSSGGPGLPALPAGLTNRWTAPSTGSDGDLIATFTDSSGGNHGTASGSARGTLKTGANGLNGRNVVRFDGVANAYTLGSSIATTGDFTIIAVMKRNGTVAVSLGQNSDFLPGHGRSATLALIGNGRGSNSGGYAEASNSTTGWEILSAAWSGNAAVRGQSNASTLSFGSTTVYGNTTPWNRIGQRGLTFGNNDLADLLYWPSVLTAQQITDTHANLNAYWGGIY